MYRWAVFDVDGTLLPGISMERRFMRHLIRQRKLPLKNRLYYLWSGLVSVLSYGAEEGLARNKGYIKGLSAADVDVQANDCFRDIITPALSEEGVRTLEAYRKERYKIMIMSGSPSFLAKRLDAVLKPDHIVSAGLENVGGYFTGNIAGRHPFGARKREILEELRAHLSIDFGESAVFANHHTDVHHMELFGTKVAVNPTEPLRDVARKNGWKIEYWK